MDFSRPRMRHSSNTSFSSGAGGGGGPQIVKTYGRFKQRMINRDAKGAQEFARAASARPILANLLDSDSSDSDFETTVKKPKSTQLSYQSIDRESAAQKTEEASDSVSTANSKTKSSASSKASSKNPGTKSTKANAKENPKTDDSTSSKPKSRARAKAKSKAKENANKSDEVLSISATAVEVEGSDAEVATSTTGIPNVLPNIKPPDSGMQHVEATTKAAAAVALSEVKNVVKDESADADAGVQTEGFSRTSKSLSLNGQLGKGKGNKDKSSSRLKPKLKSKPKQQPKSKSKSNTKSKTRSKSKSKPEYEDAVVQPDPAVGVHELKDTPEMVDTDLATIDKGKPLIHLASLPTPRSSTQSRSNSQSNSMMIDDQQANTGPPMESAPRIPIAQLSKSYAEEVLSKSAFDLTGSTKKVDECQSSDIVLDNFGKEPDADYMQVDDQEPVCGVDQLIGNETGINDDIGINSFNVESAKLSAVSSSMVSDSLLSAMPSPISSGRVTKRKTARPRRPTFARKKSSTNAPDDSILVKDYNDNDNDDQRSNRMSIDYRESRGQIDAVVVDDTDMDPDNLQRLEQGNMHKDETDDIRGATLATSSLSGLKRKSLDPEIQSSDLQIEHLSAEVEETSYSDSAAKADSETELVSQAVEQGKPSDSNMITELATDGEAKSKANRIGIVFNADTVEDPELEHASDEEDAPQRQLMGTRTIRFRAPRDARVQTFELDEDDQQMEQSQGKEQTQSETNHMDTDIASNSNPLPLVQIQSLASLQANEIQPPCTPQKKNLDRLTNIPAIDAPHSPSRMTTPHRVVYSPVNPMTIINSHRNGALHFKNSERHESDAPTASMPLIPPKFSLSQASKSEGKDMDSIGAGTGSKTGRRSTVGEIEPEFEETQVPFLPARRYVQKTHILAACGQTAPIDWASGGLQACGVLLPEIDSSTHTEAQMGEIESRSGLCKIGEATYSEVFSAQWRYVPRTRYDRFNSKKGMVKGERLMQVALKIIPFGNSGVKSGTGEPQTTLRDLYQEIGATLALSRLSERERAKLQEARLQLEVPLSPKERELGANFVKAFRICICQGPLPAPLLRAWDRWKLEYPDLCENVRPDYYPPNQLFAVFVLEMGGETLENATVSTWKEARSIIRQLALSMALAERNNRFEHRDLHWGNIMVTRSNSQLTFLYQLPPSENRSKSTLLSIPSYKVRCTIIDYTLSRLHIDNDANGMVGAKPANYDPANNVFYVTLKDEALFRGEGDIQYDVYRQMRVCSKGKWDGFHPKTNVLWLTYVLHKIITTKSPSIRDDLMAFAESKLGAAVAGASAEMKRAASQELLRRWVSEFEQSESCTQALKCALLDLYKH
ncbi:hypothetical protein LPJ64_004723 [Coemansia asiatica]|uniref:non-specific serine/threonine protein kinase n=1 Tax=Coemansia asiatica TaxID=1052880 RepID=A0A9W8CH19_9FUNG|nr:hypothetical protein LPJ64_004723 [Coemansia asiatica]